MKVPAEATAAPRQQVRRIAALPITAMPRRPAVTRLLEAGARPAKARPVAGEQIARSEQLLTGVATSASAHVKARGASARASVRPVEAR